MKLTRKEKQVLTILLDNWEANGRAVAWVDEASDMLPNPRSLGGVVASLLRKGIALDQGRRPGESALCVGFEASRCAELRALCA